MKTLTLSGPFSDDDLAEIAQLMRRIDARNPSAIFTMTMVDNDAPLDEAEAKLRRMLPTLPDRATAFARAAVVSQFEYTQRAVLAANEKTAPCRQRQTETVDVATAGARDAYQDPTFW